MSKQKWTEGSVYAMLAKRFPAPAFALLPQVRNGTGFRRTKDRTADAIAVSCYPSRGLYAIGIEIKVSLSDWRKELADPTKADEIQRFCRYWYVAAPKGVVPAGEVPETWGLLECEANRVVETKTAERLNETAPDWLFTASVVRSAAQSMITRTEHRKAVDEAKQHATEAITRAAMLDSCEYERDRLRAAIDTFEKASGVTITTWDAGRIGEAVEAVRMARNGHVLKEAERLRDASRRYADTLTKILELQSPENTERTNY